MALFIPNWVEPTRSCSSAETAASVAVRTGYVSRSTGRMRFAIAGLRLTEPRQHYAEVPALCSEDHSMSPILQDHFSHHCDEVLEQHNHPAHPDLENKAMLLDQKPLNPNHWNCQQIVHRNLNCQNCRQIVHRNLNCRNHQQIVGWNL